MKHIAPHRWADAAAGRVALDERARMTAHAASCDRCAGVRDRVLGARESFGAIAQAAPPELRWEHIGARVYWSTSKERRSGSHPVIRGVRRWRWVPIAATGALAAAATLFFALRDDEKPAARAVAHERAPIAPIAPIAAPDRIMPVELVTVPGPDATPIIGLVTLAQGDAAVAGSHDTAAIFAQPVVAGLPLTTGAGRLAVQVDAGTAFAVGADSQVTIARLDRAEIRLTVDGSISVEVSHRAPFQRFLVVAGDRTVEVRGTEFEVTHADGRVEVSCRRGLVAVTDEGETVEVSAGTRWSAADDEPLAIRPPAPLDAAQIAELAGHAPLRLPAWTEARALLATTAPVAIAAPSSRPVRIDGVVVGHGAVAVRVMSGRHMVNDRWVATRDDGVPTEVSIASEKPSAGRSVRRAQLEKSVNHARLSACMRALSKQGLAAGTSIALEIGVDATGAVSYLNVADTDLPASVASCVRDVVAQVRFPAGPAATWRHKLSF